jgi:hypothetical protein
MQDQSLTLNLLENTSNPDNNSVLAEEIEKERILEAEDNIEDSLSSVESKH